MGLAVGVVVGGEWWVGSYLHLVDERGGGQHVVSLVGVSGHVVPDPVRLARAWQAHHEDHLYN